MMHARTGQAGGQSESCGVRHRVHLQRRIVVLGLAALSVVPLVAATIRGRHAADDAALQAANLPQVRVTVEALATPRDGATGRPRASAVRTVSVGDHLSTVLAAGEVGHGDLCQVAELGPDETTPWRTRWQFDMQVLDGNSVSSLLRVVWQRSTLDVATGRVATLPKDERTIRLQTGEIHVLDLVQANTTGSTGCANVTVQVSAQPIVPPELTGDWVSYELLLVAQAAGSTRTVREARVAGTPGSPVRVSFVPVRVPLVEGSSTTSPGAALAVGVTASIRGVCRDDGSIDIDLETERAVALERAWTAGRGRKTFGLARDESVAVELPNPTIKLTAPRGSIALEGARLAPGVALVGDTVTADLSRLLAGHRFSVIVRAQCQR